MTTPLLNREETKKQFSAKQLRLAKAIKKSAGIHQFSEDFDSVTATNILRGKHIDDK
ncbi:hypothetical protein [Lysinibacillus sp. NPDC056185]|uniref:hypothetical protein n=1 Tax=Lysinibacillus sp. NPDC056185 TaxID=3345739 RepID=UPI0039F0D824